MLQGRTFGVRLGAADPTPSARILPWTCLGTEMAAHGCAGRALRSPQPSLASGEEAAGRARVGTAGSPVSRTGDRSQSISVSRKAMPTVWAGALALPAACAAPPGRSGWLGAAPAGSATRQPAGHSRAKVQPRANPLMPTLLPVALAFLPYFLLISNSGVSSALMQLPWCSSAAGMSRWVGSVGLAAALLRQERPQDPVGSDPAQHGQRQRGSPTSVPESSAHSARPTLMFAAARLPSHPRHCCTMPWPCHGGHQAATKSPLCRKSRHGPRAGNTSPTQVPRSLSPAGPSCTGRAGASRPARVRSGAGNLPGTSHQVPQPGGHRANDCPATPPAPQACPLSPCIGSCCRGQ